MQTDLIVPHDPAPRAIIPGSNPPLEGWQPLFIVGGGVAGVVLTLTNKSSLDPNNEGIILYAVLFGALGMVVGFLLYVTLWPLIVHFLEMILGPLVGDIDSNFD